MQYFFVALLVGAFLLLSCGCQTQYVDPPIAGDWSEPVNGVRMMAMPIAESPYVQGSRTVLIFTQSVGETGISLPTINPVPFVTVRPNGEAVQEQTRLSGNLRIQIESANNEGIHGPGYGDTRLQDLQSLGPELMPGEVRVFTLTLKTDVKQLMAMQQLPDRDREVQSAMSQWMIQSPEPRRYRVYLSYRPDGFGPLVGHSLSKIVDSTWSGKQIELPPFEMTVSSTDSNSQ